MSTEKRVSVKLILSLVGMLVLSACGQGNVPVSTTPPDAAYTQAALTIIAELTQSAPPATLTQPAPEPTATSAPPDTPTPPPSDTPAPTVTQTVPPSATPMALPAYRLVFSDDFSDDTDWYVDLGDNFGFEYVDESYRIYVNLVNAPIWSIRDESFVDVSMEVDVTRAAGPENGLFGLTCRHVDEDNYYALMIGSDGGYAIGKMDNGEFEYLEEGRDQADIIRRGDETNRVRADCIGETLSLYANGQFLLQVQDDDFDEGIIGLIAKTRLNDGLDVLFDNLSVYQP